ncbi:ABC transporter permease [Cryobacterium sp. TMT1-21]|uniref:ABC transporter permease n=1 Tax=Cryobacterium shii TaxID=1259235 RepID=A0AAQ2HFW9_9MICO|nr:MULTISPECIES: ABC transporter permease [Cryobacterium]TFC49255.1 ABC transporter permease [Cryobacterium shii]TFC83480.1 ABC transporter permease [Cryobacterium sp. TmT2-59]TFD16098.1 ABC transporter permease [Cryobacterium sp. TMT2-23]TFD16172.1 ABC transporter permease [Cryobacterium sp. TMT4-10]TFD18300.1 ABC transporter permease [Cryobacterium sp. TMT1-21]
MSQISAPSRPRVTSAGKVGSEANQRAPRNWKPFLLLVPAFLIVSLFFLAPLVDVFIRSITDPRLGLQNYVWLFTTETNITVTVRTFGTALLVTVVCVLLAYPYAYLMTIVGDRTRNLLQLFVMLPLWTSILVRTLAWMVLLQDTGPINGFLETAFGIGPLPLIRSTFGVALAMSQVLLPFMVLPLYSAMSKIDKRLLPAASNLGARPITAFFTVYLPLSRPGIFAGSITVFILGLGFYIIPSLLGSSKEIMISALMYQQISVFLMWGQGTALGIFLLAATVLILVVVGRLSKGASMFPGVEK